MTALSQKPFTWGAGLPGDTDELRHRYIAALRRGDGGDIAELIAFARS
ncbi:MAG: hypothetical protein ABI862_05070 [Ilumatobacteraceae bacterium]